MTTKVMDIMHVDTVLGCVYQETLEGTAAQVVTGNGTGLSLPVAPEGVRSVKRGDRITIAVTIEREE